MSTFNYFTALLTGMAMGVGVIVFAVGLYTSAGWLMPKIGAAMGCA